MARTRKQDDVALTIPSYMMWLDQQEKRYEDEIARLTRKKKRSDLFSRSKPDTTQEQDSPASGSDVAIADMPPVTGEMDDDAAEDDRDYGNSDDPDAPPEIMSADTAETDGVFDDEPADDGVNERPQDGIEESPEDDPAIMDKIINDWDQG